MNNLQAINLKNIALKRLIKFDSWMRVVNKVWE
jgi:hypothetical protein